MKRRMFAPMIVGLALMGTAFAEPEPQWDFDTPRYEIVQKTYDVPEVVDKSPHSEQAAFMSREGYLRYTTYEKSGKWITPDEATAAVQSQEEAANR